VIAGLSGRKGEEEAARIANKQAVNGAKAGGSFRAIPFLLEVVVVALTVVVVSLLPVANALTRDWASNPEKAMEDVNPSTIKAANF
jgi:hypothetical protein